MKNIKLNNLNFQSVNNSLEGEKLVFFDEILIICRKIARIRRKYSPVGAKNFKFCPTNLYFINFCFIICFI